MLLMGKSPTRDKYGKIMGNTSGNMTDLCRKPRPQISGRSILDSRMEQGTSDYFVLNFLPVI